MLGDVLQRELAFALLGAHLAEAEQPRQPAIAVTVDRISEQANVTCLDFARHERLSLPVRPERSRGTFNQIEPAADQRLQARGLARTVHPHHASERVAVGDPEAIHAELERARHQFDRIRHPPQEGKRRGEPKLDERRTLDRGRRHVRAPHQLQSRKSGFLGHQPKSPCMNQLGCPPRPSPIRPSRKIQ